MATLKMVTNPSLRTAALGVRHSHYFEKIAMQVMFGNLKAYFGCLKIVKLS
jgi:hypothetical protein